MKQASALYRLLGDEARLRLLRVLRRERLNVTELTGILGLAQSGVSRHLGLLKDAGLVVEERDAGYTFYRVPESATADAANGAIWAALEQQFDDAAGEQAVRADDARLQEVLRVRKENFDTHGGADTRDARQLVPGRSWAAWSRIIFTTRSLTVSPRSSPAKSWPARSRYSRLRAANASGSSFWIRWPWCFTNAPTSASPIAVAKRSRYSA